MTNDGEIWVVLLGSREQVLGTAWPVGTFDSQEAAREWIEGQDAETQKRFLGLYPLHRP